MGEERTVKCGKCGNVQKIDVEKVHQDISGKFMLCEKCNAFLNVEV